MTTNYVEQLDPALLCPGHEQFILFYSGPADGLFMGQRAPDSTFCPSPTLTSAEWDLGYITELSTIFAEKIPLYKYTAADIQNYLLQYRNSPDLAAKNVTEWSNKHLHLDWDMDLSPFHISDNRFRIMALRTVSK
ncbi:uncharacterized protein BDW43DRAFT_308664 [Aspergillus alliaceus]|uniref:uncharacterized protein n=1 Tax=Petromyces alliaceus TaxID=209559 RepID=UPI0012A72755|nr:uncharacterized protein BDW43DRAFT_308664 [Aspergillus alliaceus]KAB8235853.1 hypothetical protein BDW43DRAFT_308664 [Aspergillus alliaceus]